MEAGDRQVAWVSLSYLAIRPSARATIFLLQRPFLELRGRRGSRRPPSALTLPRPAGACCQWRRCCARPYALSARSAAAEGQLQASEEAGGKPGEPGSSDHRLRLSPQMCGSEARAMAPACSTRATSPPPRCRRRCWLPARPEWLSITRTGTVRPPAPALLQDSGRSARTLAGVAWQVLTSLCPSPGGNRRGNWVRVPKPGCIPSSRARFTTMQLLGSHPELQPNHPELGEGNKLPEESVIQPP